MKDEAIWLLKYNRIKQEFHDALEGPDFETCRKGLGEIGKTCKAPWGGYVLVHAHQYPETMAKLTGWTLCSSHVVACATWESVLRDVVAAGVQHRELLGAPPAKVPKTETAAIAEMQERTLLS